MPIYAYKCENCENMFEVKQRMLDEPLQECILCNENQARRVISNVGIVFKGNGFYVTDSRNGKSSVLPSGSKNDPKAEKESTVKEKKDTESKPAEKASDPAPSTK